MKRLAICVGLTRLDPTAYDGWPGDCPGCDRDAAAIARLCHDAGFDGVSVLINEAATAANIKAVYLQTIKRLSADDLLLLFNSGHGGQQPDLDGDELDGLDETLCWWDGQVSDDRLAYFFSRIPAGVRVLYLSDTCNSGSNYRGMPTRRARRSTPAALSERVVGRFIGSMLHFGGCTDGRSSYGDDDGGLFTLALLDALSDARRTLTYAEWFARAAKRMPKYQVPVFSTWGREDFSEREVLT